MIKRQYNDKKKRDSERQTMVHLEIGGELSCSERVKRYESTSSFTVAIVVNHYGISVSDITSDMFRSS
jgi:hypothetical protein